MKMKIILFIFLIIVIVSIITIIISKKEYKENQIPQDDSPDTNNFEVIKYTNTDDVFQRYPALIEFVCRDIAFDMAQDEWIVKGHNYSIPNKYRLNNNGIDPLFEEAVRLVVNYQQASRSLLLRKFSIGYNHTERLMDQLEAAGIVGPTQGGKARDVLITNEYDLINIFSAVDFNLKKNIIDSGKYGHTINLLKSDILLRWDTRQNYEKEKLKNKIRTDIQEKQKKKELEKIVMKELIDEGVIFPNSGKRPPIPKELVDAVWNRDGGKCVYCGSTVNIHIDHMIPFSKGGATTLENLQLLCQKCNIEKSDKIG